MKSKSSTPMNVEIYRGFPASVEVTDENSLYEVERLIMRLDNTYTLHEYEKEELMCIYKTARMLYLDSLFSDNDSIRNASDLYERYALEAMAKIAFIRENFNGNVVVKSDFCIESVDSIYEIVAVILDESAQSYNNLIEMDIRKDSDGVCVGFLKMKESYIASWQDMIRINQYGLSVTIRNSNVWR